MTQTLYLYNAFIYIY